MSFIRMIKPAWAVRKLANGDPNPDFKKDIQGKFKTIEGIIPNDDVMELNKLGYNAYWFPNHPSRDVYKEDNVKYLSGKLIDVFDFVFVDMDEKDKIYTVDSFLERLREFPIKPTITVKSGHGVHAYWKMKNLTREEYIITQFALLRYFKTDQSVWTVMQLMRVPGTLNTKEVDNYKRADVVDDLSINDMYDNIGVFPKEVLECITEKDKVKAQNHLNKLDGLDEVVITEDIDLSQLPEVFLKLMQQNDTVRQLFEDPIVFYGDRSGADMKLANILYYKKLTKEEILQVMVNTQKALSKGAYRLEYAKTTVAKAFEAKTTEEGSDIDTVERAPIKFKSVQQHIDHGVHEQPKDYVRGPAFFDCLVKGKWAKGQVLGLVAGSGIGKSAVTLKAIKSMIQNNYEINDDVFIFFSLEMPESEIIERWVSLVGKSSPLANRLYVIGNEDENGDPRNIGIQELHEYCLAIKTQTGKEIGSIAIDHIGIMSLHVDMKKQYTFGADSEQGTGFGDIRTISLKNACSQIKNLAKMINTFVILLTQTTKAKGIGYIPLGKDAAYGISQYENIVDYMITLWQPLQLIQEQVDIRFLAWQYAKIRHQHKDDLVKINSYKLLTYDMDTGNLQPTTNEEYTRFAKFLETAQEQAKLREDKKETNYSVSISKEALQQTLNTAQSLKSGAH